MIRNQSVQDPQAEQPFSVHHKVMGKIFLGRAVRCVLAAVIMAGGPVFVAAPGWCDEAKPAVSRGGILALPPLRALIGASDPPSYDAKAVRHVPDDVAAQEAVSSQSKSSVPDKSSSVRKQHVQGNKVAAPRPQKKKAIQDTDVQKTEPSKVKHLKTKHLKTKQGALPPISQVRSVFPVKGVLAQQKPSVQPAGGRIVGRSQDTLPVVVSSSPHSQISPPLLALSAGNSAGGDANESYRQALQATTPQVVRHDLRSLVSLSDLETVVVSSRGVKVYSPYEQPVHKGLSRAISFGGLHTNRSILVATIQYAHNSDHVSVEDRRVLEQVALLHGQNGGHVRVVGHASSKAAAHREHVNLDISRRRAQKVAAVLRNMGIPRAQIHIAATADWNPRYNEGTSAGEAGNRRTEIWFDF